LHCSSRGAALFVRHIGARPPATNQRLRCSCLIKDFRHLAAGLKSTHPPFQPSRGGRSSSGRNKRSTLIAAFRPRTRNERACARAIVARDLYSESASARMKNWEPLENRDNRSRYNYLPLPLSLSLSLSLSSFSKARDNLSQFNYPCACPRALH